MSKEAAIEKVVTEVEKEPFQPAGESLKALKDLHPASVVKCRLNSSPKT